MSSVVIKGAEGHEEHELAQDLMARIHFKEYHYGLSWLRSVGVGFPEYRREHTRVLYLDGDMVAALRLFTYTIRLGEARLKMGGFGCVTTAPQHRGKGYGARLMSDAMLYLRAHGYHVSMLFGIADFYHRWGFASVLPEYASVISVREAVLGSDLPSKHRLVKPGDVAAIQRIHNRNDVGTACSLIRISAHINHLWDRWKHARIVTDKHGKVVAYYVGAARGAEFVVEEVGMEDYRWCGALLGACLNGARGEYASSLRFHIPPTHPFVHYLLQYRSDHEMHISRNSDGMMAVVNLEETLECMIPEWELRLQEGGASSLCAEATLVVDRVPYRIRAHRGAMDVAATPGLNKVTLTGQELVQLLAGYRHVEEVLAVKRRHIPPSASLLLHTLFIKRAPYVWFQDRF